MKEAIVDTVGPWWFALAIAVAVIGVGRLVRVITYDKFPPAAWFRRRWTAWCMKHDHMDWEVLFFCPWCLPPWVALVCGGWFAFTFVAEWVAWTWWIFWGWLAISYLISMLIVRDEPYDPTPKDES